MKEALIISAFFLAVSLFSTYLGEFTSEAIKKGEIQPIFPSPQDYKNAIIIISLILIGTLIVLFLVRIKVELVKVFEIVSATLLLTTTFSFFLPLTVSLVLSIALLTISEIKRSYWIKNFILLLAIPSASALIGSSLSMQVILLLYIILSIYDFVSVYLTKHMVYLAEKLVENPSIFISLFPTKKVRKVVFSKKETKIRVFGLGAGDYFVPSILSVSMLPFSLKQSLIVTFSNTLGVFLLFYIVGKLKASKPIPALPFLLPFSLIGIFFSFYL